MTQGTSNSRQDDTDQDIALRAQVRLGDNFMLDVDTHLPGRGITAVFGPSGCGKTTLLRAVAGLTRPTSGHIVVNGDVWQDDHARIWRPTHQRPLGVVFQEASLFDHLSVQGNLDFGLRRVPASQRRISLPQAVELLGIGPLLARRPAQLSGGERQRVAIARALATSPHLLLMDEPLASLDGARKAELLPYFDRLSRELALPVLYVTHALDEVARLANHVLLLAQGRVQAQGRTADLLTRLDMAQQHGDAASALIEGTVATVDAHYGLMQVRFGGGTIECMLPTHRAAPDATPGIAPGQHVRLRVLARDVSLALSAPPHSSILNVLPATVQSVTSDGHALALVALNLNGTPLLARITRKSVNALALAPGQPVYAQIKGVAVLD
ncbi:molybdenum ABC transporter ATP-binding protein [Ottowia sp.]|uniref:molybdenum ABC transporter ATP-binding protein n=1 Tax=Ottowia sp. TaxID=1898956 RepID=UPI003A83AF63